MELKCYNIKNKRKRGKVIKNAGNWHENSGDKE